MPETLEDFLQHRPPTAERPLIGRTVLVVEDSRYVCDALRLMCQRSGARLRRADTLAAARRHLRTYRPSVVIVDLGLPDGSGLSLIRDLAQAEPKVDVLLGLSGDDTLSAKALDAGADGFLGKPLGSLTAFQSAILVHLPADAQPPGPRTVVTDGVAPDRMALRDDLQQAAQLLSGEDDRQAYAEGFLDSLAKCTEDRALSRAVAEVRAARDRGKSATDELRRLATLVGDRLASSPTV